MRWSEDRGVTGRVLGKQIRLLTILGFEVKVDLSWLFLALLVTSSLARGFFPAFYEDLPAATYWWMGIGGLIGLAFSLVFHELSHSVVARRYGLPIRGITLFIFGGVAEMEEEPASPKAEFFMAIAGPIASFFLAAAFYGVAKLGDTQGLPVPVAGVAEYLAILNLLLATFNLIPGFPLDGGRVLRSVLWYKRGDLRWATRIASRVGEAVGVTFIALGVLNVLSGNFLGGLWWALIGLFLRGAASTSYYQLMVRRGLEGEPIRRFMTARPISVSPSPTLRQFVEDYVYKYHHSMFPVMRDSHLLGCVTIDQLKEVPKQEWGRVTIGSIVRPCGPDNTIDADEDSLKALSIMRHTGSSRLLVTKDGRLVGIVALKDLLRLLALKVDLDEIR